MSGSKKKLYLIGGGGHCLSAIDVIESNGEYEIQGVFDLEENIGKKILGYPIIASDSKLESYISDDTYFVITIGQIKSFDQRKSLFEKLKSKNAKIATIVSSTAYVSKRATLGEGTIVFHQALINANAKVGVNSIINSKSLIEHSAVIGDHCHVSTAAVINGDCKVGSFSFVGSNCILEQAAEFPEQSLLKAGKFHRVRLP